MMEKLTNNNKNSTTQLFITLLRIVCFCIFAGRAYQFLVWDAPYRTLLWDQEWMEGIVGFLTSLTWEQYSTSMTTDKYIQGSIHATGWLYAICAVLSLFIKRSMKWAGYVLLTGSAALCFLSFLLFKEKFFRFGELMEMGIQVFSSVFLYIAIFTNMQAKKLMLFAKTAVALTFFGHGLYAWGYYPQPGPFIDMFINVLGSTESASVLSLKIVGILDFIVAVLIFVPRASRAALLYCVLWGGLTAFARIMSGFDSNFIAQTLNQYTFEVIFRLSHGLIPLWIFFAEGGTLKIRNLINSSAANQEMAHCAVKLQ